MKKSRVFLLAFATLVLTLLLMVGINAASSSTALPAAESAEGYLQTREDGGATYDLRLVVNANKQWLYHYREAWIDLVFAMPDGGTKSYHGPVKKLFSSALAAGETFKADESCVLFGIVVTDIPYEPLSASASLTLTKDGAKDETIALGGIEKLPQKAVPSFMAADKLTLHGLITGGQGISDNLSDANEDVASVTFGNWETYASELADTDFSAWESGIEAGVKPDTVRVFRVPKGENEYGATYDVYILSKTGRVALPEDSSGLFSYLTAMTSLRAEDLDTSAVTDMSEMFGFCTALADIAGLADWDVSCVTSMGAMFAYCPVTNLTPLTNWDVSNVTFMSSMFRECSALTGLAGLADWDVSNVTDMSGMFYHCAALADLAPLAGWNVSSVTDMNRMFYYCAITVLAPLKGWDVSSVTDMSVMFYRCTALTEADLSGWNTAHVTDMSEMFYGCSCLETVYVSNSFAVPSNAVNMFSGCTSLSGKYWNGTEYVVKTRFDPDYTDSTYARICTATEDGYLTLKVK